MPSAVIPTMRYRDAGHMIEWLCAAFGFERRMVIDDGNGGIAHAELTYGDGMIMLGSARDDEFGKLQSTPTALGGTTQSPYVIVADADDAYARAKAAGAEMIGQVRQQSYGRDFSCRDPEGHLWNLGDYNPWTYTDG
ncbi:MAG: VOC family protein [Hyphomicrobium sp.]